MTDLPNCDIIEAQKTEKAVFLPPRQMENNSMEHNKGERRRSRKEKRRNFLDWVVTRVVIAAVFVVCIISIVSTQATLLTKKQELEDLKAAVAAADAERLELEKFVDTDDIEGYMEKAAIEQLNYAYPNERRFYDTSRN